MSFLNKWHWWLGDQHHIILVFEVSSVAVESSLTRQAESSLLNFCSSISEASPSYNLPNSRVRCQGKFSFPSAWDSLWKCQLGQLTFWVIPSALPSVTTDRHIFCFCFSIWEVSWSRAAILNSIWARDLMITLFVRSLIYYVTLFCWKIHVEGGVVLLNTHYILFSESHFFSHLCCGKLMIWGDEFYWLEKFTCPLTGIVELASWASCNLSKLGWLSLIEFTNSTRSTRRQH